MRRSSPPNKQTARFAAGWNVVERGVGAAGDLAERNPRRVSADAHTILLDEDLPAF